jgi:aldehyde:ferredoxin oxidoreductase
MMKTSYPGRWLMVDLSAEKIRPEYIPAQTLEQYLGGRGIGAKLLWDVVPAGTDPLGEDNAFIIAPGALTGTSAPCSGRVTLLAKSPATGRYLKSSVGGQLGIVLKLAGVDGILITGRAERPLYLSISPERSELSSAEDIWGQGVRATTNALKERHGRDTEVVCIGPAGERLVRFAAVMTSYYNAAARGGIGAVMGAKNLKAIVVDPGSGRVEVADPVGLSRAVSEARRLLYNDSIAGDLHRFGTARDVDLLNDLRILPSYNFQKSHIPGNTSRISGRAWKELGYLKGIMGCGGCIYSCHRFTRIDAGKYAGTYSGGPEYETVASFGSGCGVLDPEPVFVANALCDDLGLDTISTGGVIQWAMESIQRGALAREDIDGLDLSFGNGDAVIEMVKKIGYREGVGDLLADGVARAAEQVGRGSEKWAVQASGLEQSRVETRGAYAYALAFAVNPRGPDHLHSECLAEFGGTKEGIALVKRLTGDEKYAVPNTEDKRAEIVRWHEDIYAVSDALGLCAFTTTAAYSLKEELIAELVQTATGVTISEEALMRLGKRVLTLERCFNLRDGLCPERDDKLPWRIMHEPQPDLPGGGEPITPERLNRMLSDYYELQGWNKHGMPTKAALDALGLSFALPELSDAYSKCSPGEENAM